MKKLLGTIFGVAVFFSFLSTGIRAEAKSMDTISKGIYIDGLDVSGMTALEAETAVNQMIEQKLEFTIRREGEMCRAGACSRPTL